MKNVMVWVPALRTAALAAALSMAGSAFAGACSVSSTGLAFGAYQPLTLPGKVVSAAATSNATVQVTCTGITTGGSYSIALGPSTGGTIVPRYLDNAAGGPAMSFNLYVDPSYSTVWGDGSTGTALTGSIPTGSSSQAHAIYGRIPAGQGTVRVGSFTGSMTMTLTYNP
ncbi:Csu type fimbrial protein [Ramlibacter albus]|uniref:Spore coat protein U domain-containing protein n=1 Tax=Ramlibacter albus TaxID=2079448 RepID=A0A923S4N6_9BURK|nr:spore coat U domain-containing protein [Ramlibacter albus]MBC5767661.1 spore coat protein U domain-containing protein [Ramlibacter albus]